MNFVNTKMPKRNTKPKQNKLDSESDENSDEDVVSNYGLRSRQGKHASPTSRHKSPAPSNVSNTSILSDSSLLGVLDKSPNISRESESSSDGYGSPNRSTPNPVGPKRLYPNVPTNQDTGARNSPRLYPNLDESKDKISQDSEADNQFLPESRSVDASDYNTSSRSRNLNENNSRNTKSNETNKINPVQHNKAYDKISSSNYIIMLLILLLGCLLIYCFRSPNTPATAKTPTDVSPYESFISNINSLEKKFPNQSKRFWNTFRASSRHILGEPNSEYPSVILMASQTYNGHIASCLAKLITRQFESVTGSNLLEFTLTDIDKFKWLSSGEQKKKLDEMLKETFHQRKSVILDNLQSLSPEAALLLHGYCDIDNAPHKDVMMVLILHVDPSQLRLDPDSTKSVEKYLQGLWTQGLHEDKVADLLSHMANNVVVINAEDDNTVKEACANLF